MNLRLLNILWSCWALTAAAQTYQVSTEVQTKNVLLEEFTGIRCGYCPDGHAVAERLRTILGDRAHVVAIHCGPYARPAYANEPDYRTEAGEAIAEMLRVYEGGFPSGSVNRRIWPGQEKPSYGRYYWLNFARQAVSETAPVNLWMSAKYVAATRRLTVHVEGYYTANLSGEAPRLNVMLTQDHIEGLQYGGGMGDHYPHRHMLRDVLTGYYGEAVPKGKAGEYFTRDYSYTVPEQYRDIPVDGSELGLTAFVVHADEGVLQSVSVKPEYEGDPLPLRVDLKATRIPVQDGYGYDFVPVVLTNRSNVPVTSALFDVNLNGTVVSTRWKGEVPAFATREIHVPVNWNRTAEKSNTFELTLRELNDTPYEGGTLQGSFYAPAIVPEELNLVIRTDETGDENVFTLRDVKGRELRKFGPFTKGKAEVIREKLHLEPNTMYCLEATDAWGDGNYPNGSTIELSDENGFVFLQVPYLQDFGKRLFFRTPVPSDIASPTVVSTRAELYSSEGVRVRTAASPDLIDRCGLRPGVYLLRTATDVRKVVIR